MDPVLRQFIEEASNTELEELTNAIHKETSKRESERLHKLMNSLYKTLKELERSGAVFYLDNDKEEWDGYFHPEQVKVDF